MLAVIEVSAARIRRGGGVSLAGKIVLVTGASSGIGQAIALACAREGAELAITFRGNQEGAEQTAAQIRSIGRRAEVMRVDVSQQEDLAALADILHSRFGRVDAWINNAGADILTGEGGRRPPLEKLDLLLAVDVRGTVLASWKAVDFMRSYGGGGVIINMSWDHVLRGTAGENPVLYSTAKGAVMSFSKSLALEVAPAIRVNVLAPGFIETAFGQEADPRWKRQVEKMTPLRRWGRPEDIAAAAVYLASDAAEFVTGQMLMVNGGVVM
jgi:3-oxoacyl-[acyl-carrier protein] reductase